MDTYIPVPKPEPEDKMKKITVQTNKEGMEKLAKFLFTELSDEELRILLSGILEDVANYQKVVRVLKGGEE